MPTPLDTTQTYRRAAKVVWRESESRVLAYDPESLEVHELNESLSRVVLLCDGTRRTEEVVVAIAERYGLAIEEAAAEVYRGLRLLCERGLLTAE